MSKKIDRNLILQAAAKALAWKLFAASGYCRTRRLINVENFDREFRAAFRNWNATRRNTLKGER